MREDIETAVRTDDVATIRRLHAQGVSLAEPSGLGNSSATIAAMRGHADMIRTLRDLGVDFDEVVPGRGMSPAHCAILWGTPQTVRLLGETGTRFEGTDSNGKGAVHLAVQTDKPEMLAEVVRLGIDVDTTDARGSTPAHEAVLGRHAEAMLEIIHAAGGRVDRADDGGWTPLHLATYQECTRAIPVLVRLGADIDRPDAHGHTPAQMAVGAKNVPLMRAVFEAGGDFEKPDKDGYTPLQNLKDLRTSWGHFRERPSYTRAELDDLIADIKQRSVLARALVLEEERRMPTSSRSRPERDRPVEM